MGAFLNKNSSKEEFDKFDENLHRLEKICTEELNVIFTSKDSFIWFTLFGRFAALGIEDKNFARFLAAFKAGLYRKKINGEAFYEIGRNGSTKDKAVIVKKLEYLETLMITFLRTNGGK